jgi:hypothetical protein
MKANLNPIRIYSKEDWEDYYNNGVIQKFIDEKNKSSELKLEYEFIKEKEKINYENHNIKKIRNIINYYDEYNFFEKLINFIIYNEKILSSFNKYLVNSINLKTNYNKTKFKSDVFSYSIKEKIDEIKIKIDKLKELNATIKNINNKIINSEIINYKQNSKSIKSMYAPKSNLNLNNINNKENNDIIISNNDEEDYILDFDDYDEKSFPSFMSFYKNRDKFHENLINETMNSINPMTFSNF